MRLRSLRSALHEQNIKGVCVFQEHLLWYSDVLFWIKLPKFFHLIDIFLLTSRNLNTIVYFFNPFFASILILCSELECSLLGYQVKLLSKSIMVIHLSCYTSTLTNSWGSILPQTFLNQSWLNLWEFLFRTSLVSCLLAQ